MLLNDKGILKIADFGLARIHYKRNMKLTSNVVTFWYKAPELLLGENRYDEKIDIWSVGCIFYELLTGSILFRGKQVKDQIQKIYERVGNPEENWPEITTKPLWKSLRPLKNYSKNWQLYFKSMGKNFDDSTVDLIDKLLTLDPSKRI